MDGGKENESEAQRLWIQIRERATDSSMDRGLRTENRVSETRTGIRGGKPEG